MSRVMPPVPYSPRPLDECIGIVWTAIEHVTHPAVTVGIRADVLAGLLGAVDAQRNPDDPNPVLMERPDAPPAR